MNRVLIKSLFCLMAMTLVFSATHERTYAEEPLKITLGGASVGGFWSTIGEAIGSTVRKEYPGSSYSYEPGSGLGNIKKVTDKKNPYGYSIQCRMYVGFKRRTSF